MKTELPEKELVINWNYVYKFILSRKKAIATIYVTVIILAIIITVLMPKKYVCDAVILLNKTSSTNLSEINPFVLSDGASSGLSKYGSLFSLASSKKNENEIEILKSPIVLDKVTKDNNLKINKGPRKGEYLPGETLLKKDLSIKGKRGSNSIFIKYKSTDPELSYNVVNSLINNYMLVQEEINSHKAQKDRKFLEKSYKNSKELIKQKIIEISDQKIEEESSLYEEFGSPDLFLTVLSKHDKRLKDTLKFLPKEILENKKIIFEVESEVEKLKFIKERFEWSILVENLSKNISNIILLKKPEKKLPGEYSEPKILINLLIALVVSFTITCCYLFYKVKTSNKISYFDLDEEAILFNNKENIDLDFIKNRTLNNSINNVGLINFTTQDLSENICSKISDIANKYDFKFKLISHGDDIDNVYKEISKYNEIIIVSEIDKTNKELLFKTHLALNTLNINYTDITLEKKPKFI